MVTLAGIGHGHQLAPDAAASFLRALRDGCPHTVTSSYRDPATQSRLRADYLAGRSPAYAAPVNKSEHVTGQALDLKAPAQAWMRANPEYGWVFTDPREAWHVAYRPALDQHRNDPPPEEEDMFNDNDRYAAKLQLESQARVELGLYVLAKQVGNVDVDEEAISRTILAALTPDKIAAAIPPAIAADVVDELTKRLAS